MNSWSLMLKPDGVSIDPEGKKYWNNILLTIEQIRAKPPRGGDAKPRVNPHRGKDSRVARVFPVIQGIPGITQDAFFLSGGLIMNIGMGSSPLPNFLRLVKRDRDARELKIFIGELQKRGIYSSVKILSQGDEGEEDENGDEEQADDPVPFDPRDFYVAGRKWAA